MLMNYFNSIKVRLKPAGSDPVGADPSFQFHKGTIKTALTAKGNTLRNYFNSIKVRLKLIKHFIDVVFQLFQFHKGTIKTCKFFLYLHIFVKFQFHKGTIKTSHHTDQNIRHHNFNSIKVRLKLA